MLHHDNQVRATRCTANTLALLAKVKRRHRSSSGVVLTHFTSSCRSFARLSTLHLRPRSSLVECPSLVASTSPPPRELRLATDTTTLLSVPTSPRFPSGLLASRMAPTVPSPAPRSPVSSLVQLVQPGSQSPREKGRFSIGLLQLKHGFGRGRTSAGSTSSSTVMCSSLDRLQRTTRSAATSPQVTEGFSGSVRFQHRHAVAAGVHALFAGRRSRSWSRLGTLAAVVDLADRYECRQSEDAIRRRR